MTTTNNNNNNNSTMTADIQLEKLYNKLTVQVEKMPDDVFQLFINSLSPEKLQILAEAFKTPEPTIVLTDEEKVLEHHLTVIRKDDIQGVKQLVADGYTLDELTEMKSTTFEKMLINAVKAVNEKATANKPKAGKLSDIAYAILQGTVKNVLCKVPKKNEFSVNEKLTAMTESEITKDAIASYIGKNTLANNTEYPLTVNGTAYNDKESAKNAMTDIVFNTLNNVLKTSEKA